MVSDENCIWSYNVTSGISSETSLLVIIISENAIGTTEKMRDLRFMDDIILIDNDPENSRDSLTNSTFKEEKLDKKSSKTKAMPDGRETTLHIDDQIVEYVHVYLCK